MNIPQGFESHISAVDGVKLHHVIGGSGDPVLLIPGWPQTWYAWRQVMGPLAEHYRVIVADIRGMGRSDKPESGYDLRTLAADLVGLMDQLGHNRFRVVGHDIGTWVGYALAAGHRERVQKLVVIDAATPGLSTPPPVLVPPEQNVKIWHFPFNQLADLPEILVSGREREYLRWLYDAKAARPEAIDDDAFEAYVEAYAAPGGLTAGFAWYRAIPQSAAQNQEHAKRKLTLPVLTIAGETGMGPVMEASFTDACEDLTAHIIAGCGHYVPEEAPAELLSLILPFLADG
jgi:pimeloyl-ACP methyl ester carboxylesterase